jgi:hypothetical protein
MSKSLDSLMDKLDALQRDVARLRAQLAASDTLPLFLTMEECGDRWRMSGNKVSFVLRRAGMNFPKTGLREAVRVPRSLVLRIDSELEAEALATGRVAVNTRNVERMREWAREGGKKSGVTRRAQKAARVEVIG